MPITKDSLLDFFKEPTIQKFKEFLQQHIGENNSIDFKEKWISFDSIAKIVLGIANSGGGCVVLGVQEVSGAFISKGLENGDKVDPADFIKKISKFIPDKIIPGINLHDFNYDDDVYGKLQGKCFQVIMIEVQEKDLPVICKSDSKSTNKGDIYTRRGTSTEKVNYDELQEIISKRVDTQYSKTLEIKLEEELNQLKALYDAIPLTVNRNSYTAWGNNYAMVLLNQQSNTVFPKETYEQFLVRMINKKCNKINNII